MSSANSTAQKGLLSVKGAVHVSYKPSPPYPPSWVGWLWKVDSPWRKVLVSEMAQLIHAVAVMCTTAFINICYQTLCQSSVPDLILTFPLISVIHIAEQDLTWFDESLLVTALSATEQFIWWWLSTSVRDDMVMTAQSRVLDWRDLSWKRF